MSNGNESYVLTKDVKRNDADVDEYTQRTIEWIKDKQIAYVLPLKKDFLFVCHKDYDQNLDVESSREESFKIMIDRNIEPGILKVMDCFQTGIDKETGYGQ